MWPMRVVGANRAANEPARAGAAARENAPTGAPSFPAALGAASASVDTLQMAKPPPARAHPDGQEPPSPAAFGTPQRQPIGPSPQGAQSKEADADVMAAAGGPADPTGTDSAPT